MRRVNYHISVQAGNLKWEFLELCQDNTRISHERATPPSQRLDLLTKIFK